MNIKRISILYCKGVDYTATTEIGEDRGSIIFRNVRILPQHYTSLQHGRPRLEAQFAFLIIHPLLSLWEIQLLINVISIYIYISN